jgi:hypothetical protein
MLKPLHYNFLWLAISFGIASCIGILISEFSIALAATLWIVIGLGLELLQPDFILYGTVLG